MNKMFPGAAGGILLNIYLLCGTNMAPTVFTNVKLSPCAMVVTLRNVFRLVFYNYFLKKCEEYTHCLYYHLQTNQV